MSTEVHELVRDAATPLLRGDLSVVDFGYAIRASV